MEGGHTYDIQEVAEEDYRYSADEASNNCDKAFSYWAKNIRNNNHSVKVAKFHNFIRLIITTFYFLFDGLCS